LAEEKGEKFCSKGKAEK